MPGTLIAQFVVCRDIALTGKNTLQYRHWRTQSAANGNAKLIARYDWDKAGKPGNGNHCPIAIHLLIRRGRRLDVANVISGWHPYQDALFCASRDEEGLGIVPDDEWTWIPQAPIVEFDVGTSWKGREEFVVSVYSIAPPVAPKPKAAVKKKAPVVAKKPTADPGPKTRQKPMRSPSWRKRRSFGPRQKV